MNNDIDSHEQSIPDQGWTQSQLQVSGFFVPPFIQVGPPHSET